MDKSQALVECEKLWCRLADSARNERGLDKADIPGPWKNYRCNCPCCEFVLSNNSANFTNASTNILGDACKCCPMYEQWMYYRNVHSNGDVQRGDQFVCMFEKSPYIQWSNVVEMGTKKMIPYDLEFFCLLIAELAREALAKGRRERT